ncbi:MbtH family protein [Nonomuraea endophytica]|uniref:MbtH protein n=1 Tax=Nonomuraea endophytica TaxID=714136 RepID=A0A7W8AEC8_9ACTN|nr:MbtH family NRPS accessory protein [Nonomuraea endophytica]MBB5083630.1 MbtH protein [Nonomuraea endophytica]
MPEDAFVIVRNHEEQYSIWPAGREIPGGWHSVGHADTKKACLSRIQELWTDMRPLSLRKALAEI